MDFFRKKWVSVVLCILMVIVAIGIGIRRDKAESYLPESNMNVSAWAEENADSYIPFVLDETNKLSQKTIDKISVYNAQMDYRYGSICGVAIVNGVGGRSIEDAAYDYAEEMQLGQFDALLLMDLKAEDWYFVYGEQLSYYLDHELEILIRGKITAGYTEIDKILPELFADLQNWYQDNVPMADQAGQKDPGSSGVGFVVLLLVLVLIIGLVNSITRVRYRRMGGFWPLFFLGRYHHFHGPAGGPHHNPGSGFRPGKSSGRPGGFGGSSRGSGFGGRGGWFGGGHRGGGFGGRR